LEKGSARRADEIEVEIVTIVIVIEGMLRSGQFNAETQIR